MSNPGKPTFDISSTGHQAVITISGDIEANAVSSFEDVLKKLLEQGHRSVVLDVAGMDFITGAGLQAILNCAGRCDIMGGTFTVRSPSPLLLQLLQNAGIKSLIEVERREAFQNRLGPEQVPQVFNKSDAEIGMPLSEPRLLEFPADHEVVNGALRLVVTLAKETVGGADGVSVSLRRHGLLSTVASSDRRISAMDADQYATGEGPCVDASNLGRWFHSESMSSETRWPEFTPRARALGINSILSSPLLARELPVGAINIY